MRGFYVEYYLGLFLIMYKINTKMIAFLIFLNSKS